MASNRNPFGIDDKDLLYFKVCKILVCEGRRILHAIGKWGLEEKSSTSFKEYLEKKLDLTSKSKLKRHFDDEQIDKIFANPEGDEFDISLLSRCINLTCNKDMYCKIRPIAKFRNNLFHNDVIIEDSTTMKKMTEKLRGMLVDALDKAKEIYTIGQSELDIMISEMDKSIKEIGECSMEKRDIDIYKEIVKKFKEGIENVIQTQGVSSLKMKYKEMSKVDPVAFLSGYKKFTIEDVYIQLDMIFKDKGIQKAESSSISIAHEDLLDLKTEAGEKPTVILIQGEAGSGKSTLAKFILADWAASCSAHTPSVRGLDSYDLVLYCECRRRHVTDFNRLICILMPQVVDRMFKDDFQDGVLRKRTLVVIDGYDEINEDSEKLLEDMLKNCVLESEGKLQFIITTRPQKTKGILKLCKDLPMVHVKISGIPSDRREEFVRKLHDQMIKESLSTQDTSKLVDYVKQSQCRLGEHYCLPLNLTFVTYLWANDPGSVNSVTSSTQLYIAALNLLKCRVMDRIKVHETTDLHDAMEKFLCLLSEVYLETHKEHSIQLSEKCCQMLRDKCLKLQIPFEEMCGAFFSVDNDWSSYSPSNHFFLSAPHKSIMEFFGANRIFTCLFEDGDYSKDIQEIKSKYKHRNLKIEDDTPTKSLRLILSNLLGDKKDLESVDFNHYHNIFIHLVGLMATQKEKDGLHHFGQELVDILQESGVKESHQWLDLVAEAECHPEFSLMVAQKISDELIVRDGHTLAALEVFKKLEEYLPVSIILQTEVKYIPSIDDLMDRLSKRDCSVDLLMNNHWKNPEKGKSTEHLRKLSNGKCRVRRFTGNLDDIKILPQDVESLRLTIADNTQAKLICEDIEKLDKTLKYIGIHVKEGVSPCLLKPLPVVKPVKKECGTIWLSGVTDSNVEGSTEIIKALHPEGMMFQCIRFPRCGLTPDGVKQLLKNLSDAGIQVSKDIRTDSKNIDKSETLEIRKLTAKYFGETFEFHCGSEASVW